MMIEMLTSFVDWIGSLVASDIGKYVLGAAGALFIAWFNTRLGIWRDERANIRRQEGQLAYSVALIVSALRQYMKNCMLVMNDDGEPVRENGNNYYEDWTTTVPSPKFAYSDKVEWTVVNPNIMYDVLALSSVEADQDEAVRSAYEHSTQPDRRLFIEERQHRYAELAALAAAHLIEIHKQHPMKFTREPTDEIRIISEKLLALEKAQNEKSAENALDLAEMQRKYPPPLPPVGAGPAVGVTEAIGQEK